MKILFTLMGVFLKAGATIFFLFFAFVLYIISNSNIVVEPLFRYDNSAAKCWHKVDRLRRQLGYGPGEPIMWKSSLFSKQSVVHSYGDDGLVKYAFNDEKGNPLEGTCRDGYSPGMKDVYLIDPVTQETWAAE